MQQYIHRALAATALGLATAASAQLAEKPSGYQAGRAVAPPGAASTVPAGWLPRLTSRQELDRLARVYDAGTALALPHVLFMIDRANGEQVMFLDSRRFALHEQFLRARDGAAAWPHAAVAQNYRSPQRRYLMGTLSWQAAAGAWAYEFWEGDPLSPALLRLADQRLRAAFFAPLRFKPTSSAQQTLAEGLQPRLDQPLLSQAAVIAKQGFLPLNPGSAVGRLRVRDDPDATDDLQRGDVALLGTLPQNLPPVAGVLTLQPSTALSHVNLLARGWGIPNAWSREAERWRALDGQWVRLTVARTGVTLVPASEAEVALAQARPLVAKVTNWPQPDLAGSALAPLTELRRADSRRCGSKAANLGELTAALRQGQLPGAAPVPSGFCIPFASFAAFMAQPAARAALAEAVGTPDFALDRQVRAQALAKLREALVALPLPEVEVQRWHEARARWVPGGRGVFVRSSSNSEDLPGFSGAGLYTTVPNVADDDAKLAEAVKTVWASVYNTEAWEARRAAGVPHDKVVMGVLVQQAVDAQAAGVMTTANPFDVGQPGMSFITAKRGLGIRVVDGLRQAEQVLYHRRSDSIQVLSRTEDPVALLLDPQGGVREAPAEPGRAVLSDALVRQLARVGEAVQRRLGPAPQDIEWAIDPAGQVVLLQSRPLVTRR
ncbi:PEP/pyruvate-binding domain-containing protein [Ideonella azotifigens]|uniref:Phosphoenolpyruvate synthase n=1 Tax=Ideonella azotifigens TaxID=513160 RepID=A0ABP3UTY0_9BURK|nr:PEP/pyruvate-binding domain-containing protein [Ideonella azotifigens]MCD2339746.1 PEP/pyruvate-binding domain-containing protein [Ideonella azotifigens]